ncbi:o-succinylbenzoate--CoA ligase [Nakamurella aerolata]|uniref:o-succinylbenzoate--CoA ligase n=1 Tax=Nakamurella aerolata TaxID=1656892 RepID=UPI001BB25BD9
MASSSSLTVTGVDTSAVNDPAARQALVDRLRAVLDGAETIAPLPAPGSAPAPTPVRLDERDLAAGRPAVVLPTSGSTGEPKQVMLSAAALRASAAATHARLGGAGGWLLALPPWHVAGLQVLLRAAGSGQPVAVTEPGPFTAQSFVTGAGRLHSGRRYVSLVPTQLRRLVDDASAVAALRDFDMVLLGGAAADPALLASAADAGVRIMLTYGMSETCGGCVYNGVALDGVSVELLDGQRIRLTGPVVANGYAGRPDDPAFARPGSFLTNDLGVLEGDILTVLGRADDVIVTGGMKVAPARLEHALGAVPGIGEVLAVGIPDDEWGEAVTALHTGAQLPESAVRQALSALPGYYRPRRWLAVPRLPVRGPGKPDRRAAAELARRAARALPPEAEPSHPDTS